jgi:ShK domain-like
MRDHCPVACRGKRFQPPSTRTDCRDVHEKCPDWASLGDCRHNDDVKQYCPQTCGLCRDAKAAATAPDESDDDSCVDTHENCEQWAVSVSCFCVSVLLQL